MADVLGGNAGRPDTMSGGILLAYDPRPAMSWLLAVMVAVVAGDLGYGVVVLIAALSLGRMSKTPPIVMRQLAGTGVLMAIVGLLYGEFLGSSLEAFSAGAARSLGTVQLPLSRVETVESVALIVFALWLVGLGWETAAAFASTRIGAARRIEWPYAELATVAAVVIAGAMGAEWSLLLWVGVLAVAKSSQGSTDSARRLHIMIAFFVLVVIAVIGIELVAARTSPVFGHLTAIALLVAAVVLAVVPLRRVAE